jgi:hypothetical protein
VTVAEATPDYEIGTPEDRAFLGHPKGLGFLGFTEACERFSYYSMQTLLVLYMVNYLLVPERMHRVIGLDWLQAHVYHGISGQADHLDRHRALLSRLLRSERAGRLGRRLLFEPSDDDLLADPRRQRRVRAGRVRRVQAGARQADAKHARGPGGGARLKQHSCCSLVGRQWQRTSSTKAISSG